MSSPHRILVVEDDDGYARLIRLLLAEDESVRYEPTRVATLSDALSALRGDAYDVVLLDLGLPDSDGMEAVVRIRETARNVPIVVLSGHDDVETALEAMRFGAQEYLVKGTDERVLLSRAMRYAQERMQMQQVEQLLVGIVGHDLRGPINTIALAADLMSQTQLTSRQEAILDRMRRSLQTSAELVRDLLDFTQTRMGRGLPIHPGPMCFRATVREVVAELQQANPERRIVSECDGQDQGTWDRTRVVQVVHNLLGNALQHSAEEAFVSVRCHAAEDGVMLEVYNEGEPIPEHIRHRLFEPLYRAEGGDTSGKRFGLGLYIVDQIVRAHGGTIDVRSDAGQGTLFSVRFPRMSPVPAAGASPDALSAGGRG